MRRASVAEWTIRRVAGKERAASIVGDLVETAQHRGSLWFCLAVAGVVVRLLWRPLVAFVAAFYAGGWTYQGLQMAVVGIHTQHRPPEPWMPLFSVLVGAGTLLWISSLYLVIRYGFRDRLAQIALLMAALTSAVTCYWWQPLILTACGITLVGAIWLSIRENGRLRAALALPMILVAGFSSFLTAFFLSSLYQKLVYAGPIGTREMQEHPSLSWLTFVLILASTWGTTVACSILHRWTRRFEPGETETDNTLAG